MKENRWAIYKGKEYSASFRTDGGVILRSLDERDVKEGFQLNRRKDSPIKCFKYVAKNEVSEIFDIIITAEYQGYTSEVIEEQEGKILIQICNLLTADAKRLSMDYATDKGIYVKWVDKSDVEISEKKISL